MILTITGLNLCTPIPSKDWKITLTGDINKFSLTILKWDTQKFSPMICLMCQFNLPLNFMHICKMLAQIFFYSKPSNTNFTFKWLLSFMEVALGLKLVLQKCWTSLDHWFSTLAKLLGLQKVAWALKKYIPKRKITYQRWNRSKRHVFHCSLEVLACHNLLVRLYPIE